MKKRISFTAFLLFLCPTLSFATASPDLMKLVEQQIYGVQDALAGSGDSAECSAEPPAESAGSQDEWFFRNIWIRLTTPTGFSIPELASFTVVPTFELLVQRPLPDGWQLYEPSSKMSRARVNPERAGLRD